MVNLFCKSFWISLLELITSWAKFDRCPFCFQFDKLNKNQLSKSSMKTGRWNSRTEAKRARDGPHIFFFLSSAVLKCNWGAVGGRIDRLMKVRSIRQWVEVRWLGQSSVFFAVHPSALDPISGPLFLLLPSRPTFILFFSFSPSILFDFGRRGRFGAANELLRTAHRCILRLRRPLRHQPTPPAAPNRLFTPRSLQRPFLLSRSATGSSLHLATFFFFPFFFSFCFSGIVRVWDGVGRRPRKPASLVGNSPPARLGTPFFFFFFFFFAGSLSFFIGCLHRALFVLPIDWQTPEIQITATVGYSIPMRPAYIDRSSGIRMKRHGPVKGWKRRRRRRRRRRTENGTANWLQMAPPRSSMRRVEGTGRRRRHASCQRDGDDDVIIKGEKWVAHSTLPAQRILPRPPGHQSDVDIVPPPAGLGSSRTASIHRHNLNSGSYQPALPKTNDCRRMFRQFHHHEVRFIIFNSSFSTWFFNKYPLVSIYRRILQ